MRGGGLRALSSPLALTANRSLGPPGLFYKSNHNYDAELACGAESILVVPINAAGVL
jgi:hypothetical protein